jgi:hypothetical protein
MTATAQYGCQAVGCQHLVKRGHLMCVDHWRMVPSPLARAVWATWKTQRAVNSLATLKAYLDAKQAAVQAVAEKQRARLAKAEASTPPLF